MNNASFEYIMFWVINMICVMYIHWNEIKNKDKVDENYKGRVKSMAFWIAIGLILGILTIGIVFMVTNAVTAFTTTFIPYFMLIGCMVGIIRFDLNGKRIGKDKECKVEENI